MTLSEINEKELKEKLLKIYEAFIKSPKDKSIHMNAIDYDRKYGGLEGYDSISEATKRAIGFLSFFCQYGEYDNNSELSKEKIIGRAKKILKDLKKSE